MSVWFSSCVVPTTITSPVHQHDSRLFHDNWPNETIGSCAIYHLMRKYVPWMLSLRSRYVAQPVSWHGKMLARIRDHHDEPSRCRVWSNSRYAKLDRNVAYPAHEVVHCFGELLIVSLLHASRSDEASPHTGVLSKKDVFKMIVCFASSGLFASSSSYQNTGTSEQRK